MTNSLKFIFGDRKLLEQPKRETREDHNPIKARVENRRNHRRPTTYVKTRGFSCRTNRDKYQIVGELYTGENDELLSGITEQNVLQQEQSGPKLVKKLTPSKSKITD